MKCSTCSQDKPASEFRVYQRGLGRKFPAAACGACRQAARRQRRERAARFRNGRQVVHDPAYDDCLRRRLAQVAFSWGRCACGRMGQLLDGRCLACSQHRSPTPAAGRTRQGASP